MKTFFIYKIIFLSTLLFLSGFTLVSAQGADLSLSVDPKLPDPGQTIRLEVKSFTTNLDASEIGWYVNDELISNGVGMKRFQYTPDQNTDSTLITVVVNDNGSELRTSKRITSSAVDLIWESDSYTPPWYLGKSLFTAESTLRFIAIPHFGSGGTDPNAQIYRWEVDGTNLGSKSGYGKNILTINSNLRDESFRIIVEAESPETGQVARKRVVVERVEPEIKIYEKSPLSGTLYNFAVEEEFILNEEEVTFTATPFFFNRNANSSSLSYSWSIDGNKITPQKREMTFRKTGGEGTARISVLVDSLSSVLIDARDVFNIRFTNENAFE